jgi:hypothetical protein
MEHKPSGYIAHDIQPTTLAARQKGRVTPRRSLISHKSILEIISAHSFGL